MRDALNLVRGAVSTKNLLPVLTHFHLYAGRVQGGNGKVVIDVPCSELRNFNCTVPAERFLKAIDACDGNPKFKLTEGGKLTVSRAKFRATLPLADHESFPVVELERNRTTSYGSDVALLPVLRKLYPFIGEDASRPWSCGILFRGGYAWATNNVCLARVPYTLPEILLPVFAVDELLRIAQEPSSVDQGDNWIGFRFEGGWWMRAQKLVNAWPGVEKFIPTALTGNSWDAQQIAEAVRKVIPFCPDPKQPVVETGPQGVSTLQGEMSAVVGQEGLPETRWRAEPLLAALDAATHIDLSTYPGACYWHGEGIDGVVVGLII